MFRTSAFAALFAVPAAAGLAQDCDYSQPTVDIGCLRKAENAAYNRGLREACNDAGGRLVNGDPRPLCFLPPRAGQGLAMGHYGSDLSSGYGIDLEPGIATVIVPKPGIGGGAGMEEYNRYDIPWNDDWTVTQAAPQENGDLTVPEIAIGIQNPGIVLPPGAIFILPDAPSQVGNDG